MKERLSQLLDIKSLVTVALLAVVCIQAIRQDISLSSEFFASTIGSMITYYFTTKDTDKKL